MADADNKRAVKNDSQATLIFHAGEMRCKIQPKFRKLFSVKAWFQTVSYKFQRLEHWQPDATPVAFDDQPAPQHNPQDTAEAQETKQRVLNRVILQDLFYLRSRSC